MKRKKDLTCKHENKNYREHGEKKYIIHNWQSRKRENNQNNTKENTGLGYFQNR